MRGPPVIRTCRCLRRRRSAGPSACRPCARMGRRGRWCAIPASRRRPRGSPCRRSRRGAGSSARGSRRSARRGPFRWSRAIPTATARTRASRWIRSRPARRGPCRWCRATPAAPARSRASCWISSPEAPAPARSPARAPRLAGIHGAGRHDLADRQIRRVIARQRDFAVAREACRSRATVGAPMNTSPSCDGGLAATRHPHGVTDRQDDGSRWEARTTGPGDATRRVWPSSPGGLRQEAT